jgi:phytoene dehydrogenase-like protein
MLDVIQSHGGDVRTHARVERILVDDGKASGVRLDGGEELRAPVVVSNAGLKNTYLGLLPEESVSQKTLKRVRRYDMALPLFCVYLGLDVDLADAMANTNYLVNPDYDVERWYADLSDGRVPDEPPLYITAASLKDPYTRAIAPKGCSNVQIMTMAPPHHSFWNVNDGPAAGEKYSRSPDYRSVKDELMEKLIDGAGQVIPNIRDHILWKEASTPITQERYTFAAGGTSYGLEHSPKQWGQRRPGFKTELRGLFVVGADTRFAHGVVGVMLGGMGCAGAVLGRDLISEVRGGRVFGDPAKLTPVGADFDAFEVCRRHRVKPRSTASKRVPVAA